MNKLISWSIIMGTLLGGAGNFGYCQSDEEDPAPELTQIEASIRDLEQWADEKVTFYAKRVSTIKDKINNLHEKQMRILDDNSTKNRQRKQARELDEKVRQALTLARQSEDAIYKSLIPQIQQIINDAFNELDAGNMQSLESFEPFEKKIAGLVVKVQAVYSDLEESIGEMDIPI